MKGYAKYVIQTDEGFFWRFEGTSRSESAIVPVVQDASIFEFVDLPKEELEQEFNVRWSFDQAQRVGGSNPRLVAVKVSLPDAT